MAEAGGDRRGDRLRHPPLDRPLTAEAPSRQRLLGLALAFEGGALILAVGLGAAIGIPLRGSAPFAAGSIAAGIGTAIGLALLAIASMRVHRGPFGELSRQVREIAGVLFARSTALDRLVIASLAGVAEEALFRGVFQAELVASLGPVAGVAAASVLFGLAHAVGLAYVVAATAAGAILGALHLATGDLAAPILAHALYDLILLEWLVRRHSPSQST